MSADGRDITGITHTDTYIHAVNYTNTKMCTDHGISTKTAIKIQNFEHCLQMLQSFTLSMKQILILRTKELQI